MKAAFLSGYGSNEVVSYGDMPEPQLRSGEVLIAVKAASVNPVEIPMRDGRYSQFLPYTFPKIPGFDLSGVVIEAYEGSKFQVGDEVFGRLATNGPGAYAEKVAVSEQFLALKPMNISHVEAASLPTVALTTWQAFFERAKLKRDDRILIHAGSGGIGTFAIQLAKYIGAHVTATAGPKNQDFLKQLGVDQVLDYTKDNFEEYGPFDVVYDSVCGSLVERSINNIVPGGKYVGLVMVTDVRSYISQGIPELIAKVAASGIVRFELLANSRQVEFHGPLTRPDGEQLSNISELIASGVIRPVVSKIFPLSQLSAAYEAIASGHTRGKISIEISN